MNKKSASLRIAIVCLAAVIGLIVIVLLASCTPASSAISSFATAETVFTAVAPTSNPESIDVDGNTIHAESFDWGGAQISEYPHWCPKPPDPEYWFQGNQFTILFVDNQGIVVRVEKDKGKITLRPEILMVSQGVSQMFNDFEMKQNDMLAIYLDKSGISFEVLFCGDIFWLTWAKG